MQLIRAFHKIQQALNTRIPVVLVLVGGRSYTDTIATVRSNYIEEATSLSKTLGLDDKVFFMGNVDYYALGQVYDRSDVVVMLSENGVFLGFRFLKLCTRPSQLL